MPDIVKVDLGQASRLAELVEAARDCVGMRRLAVLPAKEQTVIVVAGAELASLELDPRQMRLQCRQPSASTTDSD